MGVTRYTERLNSPIQGTGADGLKLAMAFLWDRRYKCPGARLVLAVHDELVVECPEEVAEEAMTWLIEAMKDGMHEIVNQDEPHVPVVVEAEVKRSWGQ